MLLRPRPLRNLGFLGKSVNLFITRQVINVSSGERSELCGYNVEVWMGLYLFPFWIYGFSFFHTLSGLVLGRYTPKAIGSRVAER